MAAGQALRLEDQNDSAYVLKKMVAEPEIATKARKAIKLDKPGKIFVSESYDSVLPTCVMAILSVLRNLQIQILEKYPMI